MVRSRILKETQIPFQGLKDSPTVEHLEDVNMYSSYTRNHSRATKPVFSNVYRDWFYSDIWEGGQLLARHFQQDLPKHMVGAWENPMHKHPEPELMQCFPASPSHKVCEAFNDRIHLDAWDICEEFDVIMETSIVVCRHTRVWSRSLVSPSSLCKQRT